jgi:hypothetical protein
LLFFYILFLFGFALAHSDLRLAPCHLTPRRDSTHSTRLDLPLKSTCLDWRLAHSTPDFLFRTPHPLSPHKRLFLRPATGGAIDALWTGGTDSGSDMAWAALPAFLLGVDWVFFDTGLDSTCIRPPTTYALRLSVRARRYDCLRRRYALTISPSPSPFRGTDSVVRRRIG